MPQPEIDVDFKGGRCAREALKERRRRWLAISYVFVRRCPKPGFLKSNEVR